MRNSCKVSMKGIDVLLYIPTTLFAPGKPIPSIQYVVTRTKVGKYVPLDLWILDIRSII